MATATERLLVRIDATTEQLRRELKAADRATEGFSEKIGKSLSRVSEGFTKAAKMSAKWAAATAAAGAAVTVALVKSGLKSADALAKTASKLGVTTEALASLRFAAQQTGIETNKFDIALQRFTRRLSDAAAGTGPAVKAFDALGLSAKELISLSPDEALGRVADAMNRVENQSQKVSLAFKLFDSEGVGLVNTLAMGSDGLNEMAKEAQALGLTLNSVDTAQIERANDAMARISSATSGLAQQLAAKVAPAIEMVANSLFAFIKDMGGMEQVAERAFNFLITAAVKTADAVRGIQIAIKLIELGFKVMAFAGVKALDKLAEVITDTLNMLPGVKIKYRGSTVDKFIDAWRGDLFETRKELEELLNAPLASSTIKRIASETREEWQRTAVDVSQASADIEGAVISVDEVTEKLATTTKQTTKTVVAEADQWTKALQGTAERIDSAFADAWRGAFDSFEQFSNSLRDAFKNLLAELAHMAITRPIVVGISGALGFGSTAASAAGGAAGGGGFGGIGGLSANALTSAEAFFAGRGMTGTASFLYGSQVGLEQTGALVGGGVGAGSLITGGAGIVGGLLSNQIFGQTSGIGSSLGGLGGGLAGASLIGGAFGGPIGALAGGLIGGGIESMFGFGKNNGNNAGVAEIDLANGTINVRGSGKSFEQANVDAAGQFAQVVQQLAAAIGGSDAALKLKVGNRGIEVDGRNFGKDEAAAIAFVLERLVDGSKELSPVVKDLIKNFKGSTEEAVKFATSVAQLGMMLGENAVSKAVDDFATAQANAGRTLMDSYQQQLEQIGKLSEEFDGSADAAAALSEAFAKNRDLAYEMATALQAIGVSIKDAAGDQIAYFQDAVRTPDQRLAFQQSEFERLFALLPTLTDPNEINSTSNQLLALNRSIFDAGPEELQRLNVSTYTNAAQAIAEATAEAIAASLGGLEGTQADAGALVSSALEGAAAGFQQSVDVFGTNVQQFSRAVQAFVNGGNYGEVVA